MPRNYSNIEHLTVKYSVEKLLAKRIVKLLHHIRFIQLSDTPANYPARNG